MTILGTAGPAVAAACQASGVAVAAGVDLTTWQAGWGDGGHVRPWRPGHVQRGRCPYVEWSVATVDSANEIYRAGGTAKLLIRLACVVRATSHGEGEAQAGDILLTALDAIRLLPGGFAGTGDAIADLVKVAGYSDVWRREATFDLALSYDFAARAIDPGAVSVPSMIAAAEASLSVPFDAGTVSVAIPSGYTVHTVRAETDTAWDGVGARIDIYLDPIASPLFSLSAADLAELPVAVEARGEFTGGTAIRAVATPGAGATAGRTRLYISSVQ